MEKNKDYLDTKLKQIIEPLFFNLLTHRPKDVIGFSLEWLTNLGGYTSNGLTIGERQELNGLRKDVKELRQIKDLNNYPGSSESEESDSEDGSSDIDSEKDEKMFRQKRDTIIARGPRIAVSAESYGNFNKNTDNKPIINPKTEDQASSIKAKIFNSFLFNSLDSHELKIVIDAMEMKEYKKGEEVIIQGDQGNCLYIVEKGELDCFKTFQNGERSLVKQYFEGDNFGELSLLYNTPRAAEVVAVNDVTLWKLDRSTFNVIVNDAAVKKREKYEAFLRRVDILSTIDNYELAQISDSLKIATFRQGEYVIKEGEMGDVFYMIEEGEAEATKTFEPGKNPVSVKYYKAGDYFGELALIKGEPRAANIIAKSNLKLVTLDRASFKRLLGPIEELLKRNAEKYTKFIKN